MPRKKVTKKKDVEPEVQKEVTTNTVSEPQSEPVVPVQEPKRNIVVVNGRKYEKVRVVHANGDVTTKTVLLE